MKKLIAISFIALLLSAVFLPTQASQQKIDRDLDLCTEMAQVAYNDAFQAEYAKCQDIVDADNAGCVAYNQAHATCVALFMPAEEW